MELRHIHFVGTDSVRRRPIASVPIAEIGERQLDARKPSGVRQDFEPQPRLDPFLSWLLERTGLDGRAYRASALQRRLPACLRALRAASPDAARTVLEQKPHLLPKAISAVLIGVSEFFRDAPVFDYLRQKGLPQLLKTRLGLRVLSAGCSEGQEIYSTAILLDELGALDRSELCGVDCRSQAIEFAQGGVFSVTELQQIDPFRRQRYFYQQGAMAEIAGDVRRRIEWRTADLISDSDDRVQDVIFFRNVGIYLAPAQAVRIWERLERRLAPGGLLITGKAERPPPQLPLKRIAPSVFQKELNTL